MLNDGMTPSEAQEILDSISYSAGWSSEGLAKASEPHGLRKVVSAVRTLADMMAAQIGPLERHLESGTITHRPAPRSGWLATQRDDADGPPLRGHTLAEMLANHR